MMQKGKKNKSVKEKIKKEETQEPSEKEGTKTLIFNLNKKREKRFIILGKIFGGKELLIEKQKSSLHYIAMYFVVIREMDSP